MGCSPPACLRSHRPRTYLQLWILVWTCTRVQPQLGSVTVICFILVHNSSNYPVLICKSKEEKKGLVLPCTAIMAGKTSVKNGRHWCIRMAWTVICLDLAQWKICRSFCQLRKGQPRQMVDPSSMMGAYNFVHWMNQTN